MNLWRCNVCVWCVCLLNISWCVYWRLSMAAESTHTCVWGCQLITFLCVLSFINIWLDMVGWVESTQTHVWHGDGVLVAAIETCFPAVTLDAISSSPPPPVYDDHDNSCDDDAQEFKIKLTTNCIIVSVIILTIALQKCPDQALRLEVRWWREGNLCPEEGWEYC